MLLQFDAKKMNELLRSFYQLTNIRIVVFNTEFYKVAQAPETDCAFCRLIRGDRDTNIRCQESDRRACRQCKEENRMQLYVCHAGLTEAVVPIHYGKMIIGFLMFGQVCQRQDNKAAWPDVRRLCLRGSADEAALYAAYQELRAVSREQVLAAAKILETCAGHIWLERIISLRADSLPRRMDEYIRANLSEDLSSAALCRQFKISRSKLYHVTNVYFGTGVEQMTRSYRIDGAKEMLRTTGLRIGEIAARVGYPDYNYFTKVFRKETGVTPSGYRHVVAQDASGG